jgi:hypothetical protein
VVQADTKLLLYILTSGNTHHHYCWWWWIQALVTASGAASTDGSNSVLSGTGITTVAWTGGGENFRWCRCYGPGANGGSGGTGTEVSSEVQTRSGWYRQHQVKVTMVEMFVFQVQMLVQVVVEVVLRRRHRRF